MKRAWVLNLECDAEFALGKSFTPSKALQGKMDEVKRSLSALVGDDVVIDEHTAALGEDYEGRAWCPTESARARWKRLGVRAPEAPAESVLRRVNHRAFALSLTAVDPQPRWLEGAALREALATEGVTWRVSQAHTNAGRGHVRCDGGASALASVREGGAAVVPWVRVLQDVALHGFVARDGALTLGSLTQQRTTAKGQWLESLPADRSLLSAAELAELTARALEAGEALFREGYYGPYGLDAFVWQGDGGARRFCARSEVNARYTMGWAVGMGDRRPDR